MNTNTFALRSVGSIVNDNFAAARIFKYYGIDFCCGGTATLAEACTMAGADLRSVIEALEGIKADGSGSIPFDSWPTDLLIDYVLKIHHRGVRAKGPQLLADIEHVAQVHGDRHPELQKLVPLFADSLDALELHLQKEEQVLFPFCYDLFSASLRGEQHVAMHCGSVSNPIRVMLREHGDEGTRYKYIRTLMNDFRVPEDACPSYRLMLEDLEAFMDNLFEHIHIENNILFPRFVELESRCVR